MAWNRQAYFLIFAYLILISIELDFSEFIMNDIDVASCRWTLMTKSDADYYSHRTQSFLPSLLVRPNWDRSWSFFNNSINIYLITVLRRIVFYENGWLVAKYDLTKKNV